MSDGEFAALDEQRFKAFHWRTTLTTGLGVFCDGYDLSSLALVLPLVLASFGQASLTSVQSALLSASFKAPDSVCRSAGASVSAPAVAAAGARGGDWFNVSNAPSACAGLSGALNAGMPCAFNRRTMCGASGLT